MSLIRTLTIAVLVVPASGRCLSAGTADELFERGRWIYQEGLDATRSPVRALSAGDSILSGAQAACVVCHRSSGMGSREGRVTVAPITGPILFSRPVPTWPVRPGRQAAAVQPLRHEARQAYDDALLARAIRSGVDSSGSALAPLMPRYALDDDSMQALVTYLRRRWAGPPRGLDANTLHLATIVTADADPERARVVTETLTAWSRSGALGGIPIDLQVWRLEGDPSDWIRQLTELQARRPVYAVLSGAGRSRWEPVRDFCEQHAVPCLFPIVDWAPEDPRDVHSLYLSRGTSLEARILARQIRALDPPAIRVVQLVDDEAGAQAARMLTGLLGATPQSTRAWHHEALEAIDSDLAAADVVVGWLSLANLETLARSRPEGLGARWAVFSAQLAPPDKAQLPIAWRREARWISLRSDPARVRGQGVLGLKPWLERLRLPASDEPLMAELYAATYFFGDALARMRGHWDPDYLIETLETANFSRPAGSAYFALSLAPGQREAAKAGYLLGFTGSDLRDLAPIGPRLTP